LAHVPASSLPKQRIKFSFRYYDTTSDRYCLSCWEREEIKRALGRLREIGEKTYSDMCADREVLHFHDVNWQQTSEPGGFPDSDTRSMSPFQFALLGINRQRARVFGALSGDTFYIVWFDKNHRVCPRR
jgi:hypothetical protein